jgi:hypothetical protein
MASEADPVNQQHYHGDAVMAEPTSANWRAACTLIGALERADFTVRLDGGQLKVTPGSRLSSEQKAAITQHVAAMTWLLAHWPSKQAQEAMDAEPRWPDWVPGQASLVRTVAVLTIFERRVAVEAEEYRRSLQAFMTKGAVRIR